MLLLLLFSSVSLFFIFIQISVYLQLFPVLCCYCSFTGNSSNNDQQFFIFFTEISAVMTRTQIRDHLSSRLQTARKTVGASLQHNLPTTSLAKKRIIPNSKRRDHIYESHSQKSTSSTRKKVFFLIFFFLPSKLDMNFT